MPANVVAGLAKRSGKSEGEVEKLWDKAKGIAKKEYPDVSDDSDRYFKIVTGIVKSMLGLKEGFVETADKEMEKLDELVKEKLPEPEPISKDKPKNTS